MNYDADQYAFSHGLTATPQLQLQHIQQHFKQQQQQPQHIFQQQYSQVVPTSSVCQFHFAGSNSPVNPVFHQEAHQMGISGNLQTRFAQHGMVSQPFINHGIQLGMDGRSVHVVNSLNGMIYSQDKSNLKIVASPDGSVIQQSDGTVRMQPTVVGMNMIGTANFIEQGLEMQQQHQGMRITNQADMFGQNKQHFAGWLQPRPMNATGMVQNSASCQNSLPSFSHVWSQFPHQKQRVGIYSPQEQHLSQYQQVQHFQGHAQHQQPMQMQPQFSAPCYQQPPHSENQVFRMQQRPAPLLEQISVRESLPIGTHHIQQQLSCFSPSVCEAQSNLMHKVPRVSESSGMQCVERGILVSSQALHLPSGAQPSCSFGESAPSTAVTYTTSGPPKVTITLDTLSHRETFSPHQFLDSSGTASSNDDRASPNFVREKAAQSHNSASSENCPMQHQQECPISQIQKNVCLSKPLLHTSSTGSSLDRCSSESSNFSSSPYTFTPPSSMESRFSPVHPQLPKSITDNFLSDRTSSSSSSSSASLSPPAGASCMGSWAGCLPTGTVTTTGSSSTAPLTCTTTTTAVAFSCSTIAMTTTSVTSTTPVPKESTSSASVHSGLPLSSVSSCTSEYSISCSPTPRLATSGAVTGPDTRIKVPYSWHRKCVDGVIYYKSPSGVVLQSLDQVCQYLLSDSTCKCGLECPLQLDQCFSFDPELEGQPWTANAAGEEIMGNLCNHRREILALAAYHSSQLEATCLGVTDEPLETGKKRERKKSLNAGEGLIVSPLKRLKTSIKNAVNKHATTAKSSKASTAVKEKTGAVLGHLPVKNEPEFRHVECNTVLPKPECLNQDLLASKVFVDKMEGKRSLSRGNQEDLVTGGNPHHCGNQNNHRSSFSQQQRHGNQQIMTVEDGHRTHEAAESSAFHQAPRRDVVSGGPNHFVSEARFQGSQHYPTHSQPQLPQHHYQQMNPPNLYFSQGHVYKNMPSHISQQPQQGFHTNMWQEGNATTPPVMLHQHCHQTGAYPAQNMHFQHSGFNQSPPNFSHNSHTQQAFGNHLQLVDPKKSKSKRPKSKRDKRKQINSIVDRSSPCSKINKTSVVPTSTAASFFGNPIVFVEQQAAIINNSIASCHIGCQTPSPPICDSLKSASTYNSRKDILCEPKMIKPDKDFKVAQMSLGELNKRNTTVKDEEDDHKVGTDLDSNKSFSDTTENNDSAYLSQTGSDQEKSDTIDGLDSSSETKPKICDLYYYKTVKQEDKKVCLSKKQNVAKAASDTLRNAASGNRVGQESHTISKISNPVTKSQENKKLLKCKPKPKTAPTKNNVMSQEMEMLKKAAPNALKWDASSLVSSNGLDIPALQQVLTQFRDADSSHLGATLRQVWSQVNSSAGGEFPASNLLSAAAKAQVNLKQKEEGMNNSLPNLMASSGLPHSALEIMNNGGANEIKSAASTTVCGTVVNSIVAQQPLQHSFQQVGNGANLIGNMIQLPTGNITMNMLIPAAGQNQGFTSDFVQATAFGTDLDLKSGSSQGALNPLMASGLLTTVSQTGDLSSQIKLPMASVIPSSLGSSITQCRPENNTVIVNNFGSPVIVNTAMPPSSVSVVTNVTRSIAQVVPTINFNQTTFGTQQVTHQILGATQQNGQQIIGTRASAAGPQLVTAPAQGAHLFNSAAANSQLVCSTSQAPQIVNTLSVTGLNNQLLITNPISQVSPSNSISQLSPAMAANILTHGHQQLQQMSPSFLPSQLQKQNPVINSQSIFTNMAMPTLAAASGSPDVLAGSISQANIISNNIQKSFQVADTFDKVDIAAGLSQIKDANNTSLYATTSQPVLVIPHSGANQVMQMLRTAQPFATAPGLSTDLNAQPSNLQQILSQSANMDQFQNLLGFNPLSLQQQLVNTVSLPGVHHQQQQQQQQLQILQLQQLMLQQLQNQSQNIQRISIPFNANTSPSQVQTLGTPTIVNAIMPQQGLQLNPMMDLNSLNPCLSPVAQGFQNQFSATAVQLQHISPALTVQQISTVNPCGVTSVIPNTSGPNLIHNPAKDWQSGKLQPVSVFVDSVAQPSKPPVMMASNESQVTPSSNIQQLNTNDIKSPIPTLSAQKSCQLGSKSKPKPKAKKSEGKKVVDPESERNEEDIAATVQQILAQAVQQQRELSLASKNQPPPPAKSKSKKSQSRSKANQCIKEHELGKIASISDDIIIPKMNENMAFETANFSSRVGPTHYNVPVAKTLYSDDPQSIVPQSNNHVMFSSPGVTPPLHSLHILNGKANSNPVVSSNNAESALHKTHFAIHAKKSSISLKDHLSSIVLKDKESVVKKHGSEVERSLATHPASAPGVGNASFHPKLQRKSIK